MCVGGEGRGGREGSWGEKRGDRKWEGPWVNSYLRGLQYTCFCATGFILKAGADFFFPFTLRRKTLGFREGSRLLGLVSASAPDCY